MANVDSPIGFWPSRHLTGGEIRTTTYKVKASTTIYKNDLLIGDATGTVTPATVDAGAIVVGVAAEYKVGNASGTTDIEVYDDPFIVFGVQMDDVGTDSTAADIFATANHIAGAGSATTYLSGHELDMSDIGTGAQLRILGLCQTRDAANTWGDNADVEVLLNEHIMKAGGATL